MSYFDLFPKRKDHKIEIFDTATSQIFTHRLQFPDFFRHVILYSDKLNDGNYAYLNERIFDGERPDQLSNRLYGSPDYYWTFFILNPHLRLGEQHQWHIAQTKLEEVIDEIYNGITCNVFNFIRIKGFLPRLIIKKEVKLFEGLNVGDYVIGRRTKIAGQITFIRLKYGQIGLRNIQSETGATMFLENEIILKAMKDESTGHFVESTERDVNGNPYYFVTNRSEPYKHGVYKYIDTATGEEVDNPRFLELDAFSAPEGSIGEITFRENVIDQNEALKRLRVLSPSSIEQFTQTFRTLLRTR